MTTSSRPATAISVCLRAMTSVEHTDIASTLNRRKVCVTPQGTTGDVESAHASDMAACILGVGDGTSKGPFRRKARRVWLTASVVTQVHELVTPLGQNPQ